MRRLRLPVFGGDNGSESNNSFEEIPKVSRRILIVDDEPFNLQSLLIIVTSAFKTIGINQETVKPFID